MIYVVVFGLGILVGAGIVCALGSMLSAGDECMDEKRPSNETEYL